MIIQGTPEWFAQRLGRVTASRISDVMAKTKTGYSASRADYMAQLVAERMSGVVAESYTNDAMRRGTELEPDARAAYEAKTGVLVDEVAMIPHPTIAMSGASPDGLAGDSGLVEIKCPNTATHISYLLSQKVPQKYVYQMQWQMACTERDWCDFVSYDPRIGEKLQLWVTRVHRDPELIAEIESEVKKFLSEVDQQVDQLNAIQL